jgi:hypothetical protein
VYKHTIASLVDYFAVLHVPFDVGKNTAFTIVVGKESTAGLYPVFASDRSVAPYKWNDSGAWTKETNSLDKDSNTHACMSYKV